MSKKILAFYSPYPGAGKTTAAQYLGNTTEGWRLSFAEPLDGIIKGVLADMGLIGKYKWETLRLEMKETPLPELGGASIRAMLLAFGAAGRSVYPNIWVDCMKNELKNSYFPAYFIDDLRFPNEYAMLREEGAKIVRITNPGSVIMPSETEALLEGYEFDAEIVNDSLRGLNHYKAQLAALLTALWPE